VENDEKRGRSMQIRFKELRELLLNKGIDLEACWRRKDDAIGTIQPWHDLISRQPTRRSDAIISLIVTGYLLAKYRHS
jgi:hypothetical protein